MGVAVIGLTIAASNGAIIIAAGFHFALALAALFAAWGLSTVAAAAVDGIFTWPRDGLVDPAPYQRLPNLDWRRSNAAVMTNHYFASVAFAVISLGLIIAAANFYFMFSPVFHFGCFAVSVVASAGFLVGAATVQNRNVNGRYAVAAALWVVSGVLAVLALALGITYACGASLFGHEYDLSAALAAFISCLYSYYRAAREYDRAYPRSWRGENKSTTSIHMFIIAAAIAVVGIILAFAGIGVSTVVHVALVGGLWLAAFVVAVIAGLLCDRKSY